LIPAHHAAIHEAGHAIIARILGVPARRASIAPEGDSFGFAETADPDTCRAVWASQGRVRPYHYANDACCLVSMSGVISERIILGVDCGGHSFDIDDIARYIEIDPRPSRVARLVNATTMLVERHRARIERLAALLSACGTLSGGEIDRMFFAK
jgi:hypothetical protein